MKKPRSSKTLKERPISYRYIPLGQCSAYKFRVERKERVGQSRRQSLLKFYPILNWGGTNRCNSAPFRGRPHGEEATATARRSAVDAAGCSGSAMQFASMSRLDTSTVAAQYAEDGDAVVGPQAARSKRLERTTVAGSTNVPFFTSSSSQHHGRANVGSSSSTVQPHREYDDVADATSSRKQTHALERLLCVPAANCHLQIAQLQDEKEFLTKYVERILNQLRVVLQKHGELEKLKALTDPQVLAEQYERMAAENADDGDYSGESGAAKSTDRLAPWLTSQEYTNPLLQAYDLKIYELVCACVLLDWALCLCSSSSM